MIPQRGLLGNKTWRETLIDLEVYELNVDPILTAKRFSPTHQMCCSTFDARNLPVRFDEREQETEPSQTGLR